MTQSNSSAALRSRSTIVALIVAGAFFMENLDGTVIATALPQMADSFGVSAIQLSIGITAYMLTVAIFIPASGWMADRFGTRTVFCGAIAAFTVASVACGIAPDVYSFVAARIVQGAAGALMSPVGRLVVLRGAEKAELLRTAAIVSWPGLVAPVLGPPLGGFITTYADWRWIFFLNVPLGLIGIALALRFIEERREGEARPFDGLGFALTGTAMGALMYGFDRVGVRDWIPAFVLIGVGAVLGFAAVRHAERHSHPLIGLSPMKVQTFAVGVWAGVLFRMAVGATPVLLPLMFQRGFGMSAFASGSLALAYAVGNIGMKPLTTPILRWFGFRSTMIADGILCSLFILCCGLLTAGNSTTLILFVLLLAGGFRSLGLTCLFTLPFVDITAKQRGDATTLMNVVQQAGYGLGAAFGSTALQVSLLARGAGADALTMTDFRAAFAAVALIGAAALPSFIALPRNAGTEVSGHRKP